MQIAGECTCLAGLTGASIATVVRYVVRFLAQLLGCDFFWWRFSGLVNVGGCSLALNFISVCHVLLVTLGKIITTEFED